MADGHTANTRVEEAVTALCAIKDSKHRSFYALWKITKLFGGTLAPKSVDSNNRRSHDDGLEPDWNISSIVTLKSADSQRDISNSFNVVAQIEIKL